MKKKSSHRFLGICLFAAACLGLNTGCNTLGNNIWFGFSAGLGGIPATIVGNLIVDALTGATAAP